MEKSSLDKAGIERRPAVLEEDALTTRPTKEFHVERVVVCWFMLVYLRDGSA